MPQALVLIDLINDLIAPEGRLSGKGSADFVKRHETLNRVAALLEYARHKADRIIHVRVGFSPDYGEQPKPSPLFKHAAKLGALKLGDWGTEFVPQATPLPGETIITKHRTNAFIGTPLELILRNNDINKLTIAGCMTDIGLQTTARAAHDLDYQVCVIGDCCAAHSEDDHNQTLRMLAKVVQVSTLEQLMNP